MTCADSGLGIGLALVEAVVTLHGGQVYAYSEGEECGSTFEVRLPQAAVAARDGAEAVPLAQSFGPDLALIDIGMPNVDGYEAARRIRQAPWGADINLVALTGWGQPDDRVRALAAGFDLHMVKPLSPQGLEELLGTSGRPDASSP